MANDLELIKQLEKEIGEELEKRPSEEIPRSAAKGFYADEKGEVTGVYLDNVKLDPLPVSLLKFRHLKALSLYSTQIKDISFLQSMSHLTALDLSSNQLTDISFLQGLSNLTSLALGGNEEIKDYSFLQGLSNLTSLELYSNQLTDISFLQGLSHLTSLSLSDNQVSDISFLQGLSNLTSLTLSYNQVSDISFLQGLSHLTSLNLHNNQVSDISFLQGLSHLKRLDLRKNKIKELPEAIVELDMEIDVDDKHGFENGILLYGNPLETPPIEIVKEGKDAIRAYFRDLKKGEELPLNEVKVLLVGDGEAGKTSLVKRIKGKEFDKNEPQTHGINIDSWMVKNENNKIKSHLWDFGGQEIMHATHHFFLSKRSLYILVLDARKEEDKTEYWLKLIESFGGNSPVLVVINKIDENPGFEVNRKFLLEKYKNIKGFHRVSCKTGEDIKTFIRALEETLWQVEIHKTTWVANWFNVKTRLETMTEHFISIEDFRRICTEENITEKSSRNTLVGFLNDLGVVLHFEDIDLGDTHVLEPRWVTEAVYKIINSRKLAAANGVLPLDLMETILKKRKKDDYEYPEDKYRFIVQLMRKFELCYRLDTGDILVPDLLEVEEPEFDFDYTSSLKFILEYDYLPKSVMPRFIVRRHADIKNNLQWRTGVVLEDNEFHAVAVVKADERDRKITIHVNGQQKRDYFAIVRKTLNGINATFEKLKTTELVPLTDNHEVTVEYNELIGHELERKNEIFIGKLRKSYNVGQMLDGIEKKEDRMKHKDPTKISREKGGDVYVNVEQNVKQDVKQEQNVKQEAKQETHIDINIKIDLPAVKRDFFDLKDEIEDAGQTDPKLAKELETVGDSLDDLTLEAGEKELVKPFNKLHRFLEKLSDKDSNFHKVLKGTKKGIETAQKIGRTYNKFAQWLALPQIPDVFVKMGKD